MKIFIKFYIQWVKIVVSVMRAKWRVSRMNQPLLSDQTLLYNWDKLVELYKAVKAERQKIKSLKEE